MDALSAGLARGGPRALIEWCREGNLVADTNLLLLVDQFEELFTYSDYDRRQRAEAFVSLLLESRSPIEVEHPTERSDRYCSGRFQSSRHREYTFSCCRHF